MLDTEAVLRFRGEDQGLLDVLESMNKGLDGVKIESRNAIDNFDEFHKKEGGYKESFQAIQEGAEGASKSLRSMSSGSRGAWKSFSTGANVVMGTSDVLDRRMVGLASRFIGTTKATQGLASAIGPTADVFSDFADAGSNTERVLRGVDYTAKPLSSGLGAVASGLGAVAEQAERFGVVGGTAAKVLGVLGAQSQLVSKLLGKAGFVTDIYLATQSVTEMAGKALPMLHQGLSMGAGMILPQYAKKLGTWKGRMELAEEAAEKLRKSKGRLAVAIAGVTLKITGYIKVLGQLALADDFVKTSTLRWNEFNKAVSTFQSLGLDSTVIEIGAALAQLRLGFLLNAEAAQQFFDISVKNFAKLQDKLAFTTTLSAGASAGIENMGSAMQSLVNGPLQNQVTSLDATNALYNAMSAGMTELGEAQKFLSAGLKLSGATGADSAQSIELLAKVQQAYGLTAGQAAETAAKLNGVVENGITTFPRLTGGLARTAGVAKQSGVELDELLGSIAALTKTMSTDDAMTGYSSLLQSIAGQGEQSSQAIASLGIQFDVNSIKSKGLIASLNELYTATGGSTEKLKRIIPDSLAFSTALSLMTTAAEDASDVTERIGTTGAESLDELFGNRRQSLVQQMTALTNGFNEVLIDFGERLAPVIQPAVDMLQVMLEKLQNMPEPLKQFIAGMVMTGFAASKAKDVFGGFVSTLVQMGKAYLVSRTISLAFRGELLKEVAVMKEMVTVHGNLSGAILRLFGIKDGLAARIQDVTGVTRLQLRTNLEAAKAQERLNLLYTQFSRINLDGVGRGLQDVGVAAEQMARSTNFEQFEQLIARQSKEFATKMREMAVPAGGTIKALTGETVRLGNNLKEVEMAAKQLQQIRRDVEALPESSAKTQALKETARMETALEERRKLIMNNERKIGIARVKQAEVNAAKQLAVEKKNLQQIAAFRRKVETAENVSASDKRNLRRQATELERQARARLRDVQVQQESLATALKSNSATKMNTAAKAANAKMTNVAAAAEASRGKKVGFLTAWMNKLTGSDAVNTVGTKKNATATLTLAQAKQVAASSANQLSIAQAKNTIAQAKGGAVAMAAAKAHSLAATSVSVGAKGMNLARGAVQALTIGFKKLLTTLLPFAKILLPLAAAFVVLQDFVPALGGMAKKMKEFADSAKEADEKIAALNDNLATTAQTQREVVIQQDDFNSNLARMYNFMGKVMSVPALILDGIAGSIDAILDSFTKMHPIMATVAKGLTNLFNFDYGSKAKDAEKQLQSLQEELGRATNPEQVARLNAEISETEEILKNNVTLTQRWQRFIAGNAKNIDDALQGGRLEEQDRRMRLMDTSFQQSINMRENLAQGLAATEEARAIEAQVIAEQRVLTAEELKRVTELETEAIKDRIAENELHIGVAEDALKIEKDPQRREILRQRISDLQEEGGALNEAARAMEKYRQNLATLRNRILDNDAATGSERTLERISNLRNEMVTAFEESDVGEEGRAAAEEMFDQFTEGINTASLSQRRAAVKLTGTLKTYLENATRTGVGELDPAALAANIERYYEAINEAAASGAIGSSQKNEMLQALMDQTMNIQGLEGNIMPPELLQQIEQELIDGIKAMSEKRITEKQHEIGAIQDLELQGALGPIEAIEQRAALEDQILEDRLQAQRETTAEIGRLRGQESSEYKASLRELETLERNTRRQRVENERSIAKQVTDYNISLKQHEIGEIKSLEMQGALAPVEAAEEQLRLEREILDQRLEGQREVLAALEEMVGVDSEEYKKALRELEVLERTSVEQRINGQKRLFEARMQEVQHETKIVMDALQLSETELNTQVRQLLNDGAISAIEADEMRLSSAKERNRQELENTRQMIQHIKAELAALIEAEGDTDSPLQRQLEGQLRGAIQSQAQLALNAAELEAKANDIVAKKIEERAEIAQQAIERQVMGIQQETDAYNQQIRLLENRNKLLSAAAQLQQSRNALENFGLESELQMLDTAIGLQSRLRDLRDQPEYHDRVLQLLDRIGEGGQNELEMLEKKQKKEMQLAEQKHKQLLIQQAVERQQLELQLQMEEVRARAAIQEAEIAVLKGVQAKLAAETAVAAAIERGDEAAERRARLQVDVAERSAALAEQQVGNAEENLRITREMAGSQRENLRTQQQLAREQSEEQLEQLEIQHEMQQIEAEVNAARRDRQAQEDARQASQAQLDTALEVLTTIEKQNRLLEIQREAATTLRDVQKEALGMLAQLESNPYRRRKAEQEMARVRLDGLRQAQEMERRQLEMTLRREELELRIAAIKNQAAQAQSQVEVGRAQQQLQSARRSGSQAEVAAAEANLELAMAQGMATAMEGLGIEEQLSVLRESADMQREQLDYQQQMQRFQVRQENLSSLRPGQQRYQERLLRNDVRQFTRRIRQPVRNARDNVRALSESDTRVGQMDAVLASIRGGGGLDALMGQSAELFNRRQSPPSPRIQRPSGMQSSRQRQEQERTKVENVSLNNTIEINLPPGQDSPQETAERLKQAVLNTMYDVTVEMRR